MESCDQSHDPCTCSPPVSNAVKEFELAMQKAIGSPFESPGKSTKPQLRLSIVTPVPQATSSRENSFLPSLPNSSPAFRITDGILAARSSVNSQLSTPSEQTVSFAGWETIDTDQGTFIVARKLKENEQLAETTSPKISLPVSVKKSIPVRKVSTGRLTPSLKVRPTFKGTENERKLPPLRFSSGQSPVRSSRTSGITPSSKSKLGLKNVSSRYSPATSSKAGPSTPKSRARSEPGTPRPATTNSSKLRSPLKSKIPIPTVTVSSHDPEESSRSKSPEVADQQPDDRLSPASEEHEEGQVSPLSTESTQSYVVIMSPTNTSKDSVVTIPTTVNTSSRITSTDSNPALSTSALSSSVDTASASATDNSPNLPVVSVEETQAESKGTFLPSLDAISLARMETLHALGYHDPMFQSEKSFLKDFPELLERLESRSFQDDCHYELATLKRKELSERMRVVNNIYRNAKRTNAAENEMMCITGWGESLLKEVSQIEDGHIKYHKSWVRHVVDWLWGIENIKQGRYNIPPEIHELADDHPLFNLKATVNELMRQGFNGKEKDVILLWGDIRGVPLVASACGKAILHEYITRLTRWDGGKLENQEVQERRMHYFCLRHYNHWKAAVSHYNLVLKMMNLLIVFHDLWGMHVDGMTIQEKNDYGHLRDNLYDFACMFERPNGADKKDSIWIGNECFHCFCQTAANPIEKDRSKFLWYWLLLLSSVIGYGSYHAALLQLMTAGKSPEYINSLLDSTYYSRQYSMMVAVKRISAAVRKQAKVDSLIRPLGTISNKYVNVGPIPLKSS